MKRPAQVSDPIGQLKQPTGTSKVPVRFYSDESETFREIWESWDEVSQLEPTGDPREERRQAFYAGAIGLMGVFLGLSGGPGDAAYFISIRRELEAFAESLWGPK